MSKCFGKILNYNPGEKSLKVPFSVHLDLECLLKNNLVKITIIKISSKNLTQRKELSMSPLVGQCLKTVHLIKKKINVII